MCAAELVCKEWYRVINVGMLWRKLIERKVRTDSMWKGLSERRGWYVYCFQSSIVKIEVKVRQLCIFIDTDMRFMVLVA